MLTSQIRQGSCTFEARRNLKIRKWYHANNCKLLEVWRLTQLEKFSSSMSDLSAVLSSVDILLMEVIYKEIAMSGTNLQELFKLYWVSVKGDIMYLVNFQICFAHQNYKTS